LIAGPEKGAKTPPSSRFSARSRYRLIYQGRGNPRILSASNKAGLRDRRFVSTEEARGDDVMPKGTVKWFNPTKGYGFIQPATGGKDIFVHISAVQKAGLTTLNEGQSVEYEEIANRGKTSAENLKV
jgi:CspA family cold shock protein